MMFINYYFSGELGKELLYIRNFSLTHTFPSIGMQTSHEWLSYGPFYYYIMIPIYNLFNGNPYILLWMGILTFVIGIVLSYFVVSKIVNKKVAIYSSLLQIISPIFIWQTSLSKLHTFFFILSPILMLFLYKLWNKDKQYIFWTGLIYGLMFSFHFSQIPLFLVILLLLFIKKYKFKEYLKLLVGIFLPNLGIIYNDLKIFLWLPYRVVNLGNKSIVDTLNALNEYFGRNLFWDNRLWYLGSVIFIITFVWCYKKSTGFIRFYLLSTISIMLIANIMHGNLPIHYFLPIFTTLPILFAVYISRFKYAYLLVLLIILINFKGYFNFQKPDDFVPIQKQIEISKRIIERSKGEEFAIKRIGPYDYFPENYSQNYKYLIYYYGGNLNDNAQKTFIINENNNFEITEE